MLKQSRLELIDFLDAMRESAMNNLEHQNYAYMDLKEQKKNFFELTEEIIDGIDNNDRETIMRYLTILEIMQGQELDHLYYAGYRDCISLLKSFGVL
jgi:hypothetical protein